MSPVKVGGELPDHHGGAAASAERVFEVLTSPKAECDEPGDARLLRIG